MNNLEEVCWLVESSLLFTIMAVTIRSIPTDGTVDLDDASQQICSRLGMTLTVTMPTSAKQPTTYALTPTVCVHDSVKHEQICVL